MSKPGDHNSRFGSGRSRWFSLKWKESATPLWPAAHKDAADRAVVAGFVALKSLVTIARDAGDLIRAFGRGRAHIVGHDWGGIIGWLFAALYPDMVDRLASTNPHAFNAPGWLAIQADSHSARAPCADPMR